MNTNPEIVNTLFMYRMKPRSLKKSPHHCFQAISILICKMTQLITALQNVTFEV
jgi:hypothetical protein